jgi:hypothetical protein
MGDVTYTHNNAPQAVARARTHATWPVGMCLNHVWDCVSSQTKNYHLPDANAGWAAATLKRYDRNPPAGAPVYWSGYQHGHIAISVGGGRVRSTDCPSDGRVSELAIADIPKRWPGLTYRGYSLDFAGDWIDGIAPIPPGGLTMSDISTLTTILRRIEAKLDGFRGEESNRYPYYAGKFNEILADMATDDATPVTIAPEDVAAVAEALAQKVVDLLPKAPGA